MLACKGIFTPCINNAGGRQHAQGAAQTLTCKRFCVYYITYGAKKQILFTVLCAKIVNIINIFFGDIVCQTMNFGVGIRYLAQ